MVLGISRDTVTQAPTALPGRPSRTLLVQLRAAQLNKIDTTQIWFLQLRQPRFGASQWLALSPVHLLFATD